MSPCTRRPSSGCAARFSTAERIAPAAAMAAPGFGLGAESDDSGRFSTVVVGLFYMTLAVGTFLGGILIDSSGFSAIAGLTAVCTTLGLLAVLPASIAVRAHRRTGALS